jgi:hypothetical protein
MRTQVPDQVFTQPTADDSGDDVSDTPITVQLYLLIAILRLTIDASTGEVTLVSGCLIMKHRVNIALQ